MKRFMFSLFALGALFPYAKGADTESKIPFDSLPQWIEQHIEFPQEALKYGMVGVERFVVSLSWNGKPYISRQLNTLNPAVEKAIIDVMEKAPTCSFSECIPQKELYQLIEIDFYKLMPGQNKATIIFIPEHTAPIFTGQKDKKAISAIASRLTFIIG